MVIFKIIGSVFKTSLSSNRGGRCNRNPGLSKQSQTIYTQDCYTQVFYKSLFSKTGETPVLEDANKTYALPGNAEFITS